MRRYQWFLISAGLFLVGLISLAAGWKGSASFNLAEPVSGSAFNFCGSAHGWYATIAILAVVLAILMLVFAIIHAAIRVAR